MNKSKLRNQNLFVHLSPYLFVLTPFSGYFRARHLIFVWKPHLDETILRS